MKNNTEIYVHIPFCVRKCAYCDFTSFVSTHEVWKRYFDMLNKEIEIKAESVGRIPVDSVFIGGGTPSLVDEYYIVRLVNKLRECFDIIPNAEITIESNPNSLTLSKLVAYKECGINRLSMGLQSADNEELKGLSRVHTYEEFLQSYENCRKAGFTNVNIDLMSAIPGQTVSSYKNTLEKVLSLNPEHISAYSLIVEENTPFYDKYKDGKGLPSEEEERQMYYLTEELLLANGYHRYEISNYAKEGKECRHNLGYWTGKSYLGFGIAAASYFNNRRNTNHSSLKKYLEGNLETEYQELSEEERMEEFMFLGLRLIEGVNRKEFTNRFGKDIDEVYKKPLEKLEWEGLLTNGEQIRLTHRGLDLANYCMAEFLF